MGRGGSSLTKASKPAGKVFVAMTTPNRSRAIRKGATVYIAYRYAPSFADRIRDPFGPLLCIDKRDGVVTVAMLDGSPFKDGSTSVAIAHNRIVLNPPPSHVRAA